MSTQWTWRQRCTQGAWPKAVLPHVRHVIDNIDCPRRHPPAIIGHLGADEPRGVLGLSEDELVILLGRPNNVVPQLLVHIGVRLCAELLAPAGRLVAVVEEPLQAGWQQMWPKCNDITAL